jgi:hypothetical protein
VLAVPRSIPMSREKRPRKRSSMVAGRSFEIAGDSDRAQRLSGGGQIARSDDWR